jgi:hypothetical protein
VSETIKCCGILQHFTASAVPNWAGQGLFWGSPPRTPTYNKTKERQNNKTNTGNTHYNKTEERQNKKQAPETHNKQNKTPETNQGASIGYRVGI